MNSVIITTIGLVVHSAADGAALGASLYLESLGEKAGLGLLIFAAIMCHKAPASFGFGTVLVQNNLSVCSYAKHLGAFTGSSPIVNLLVYFGLAMTQNGSTDLLAL